ncbi:MULTISPECIES: hypothetical protein [unclassified Mannheimia]|uniref:hypothetical protein n=1 Tax=unclassified Mannheimia TaxID=2645054 RepID=UPI00359E6FFA
MNNPYYNVSQEYLDYLHEQIREADEDIKHGRVYSIEEMRAKVIAAAFEGAKNAKRVA